MSDRQSVKPRYYIGRWNGKSARVERVYSKEHFGMPANSTDKSSDLFDSAMQDSDSSPEKAVNKFQDPSNSTLPAMKEKQSGLSQGHQSSPLVNGNKTEELGSSDLTNKWGSTSRTRNQMRQSSSSQAVGAEISNAGFLNGRELKENGTGSQSSRKNKLETSHSNLHKRPKLGNDRFALSSEDEDFWESPKQPLEQPERVKFGRDEVEVNFLGEPVNSTAKNGEASEKQIESSKTVAAEDVSSKSDGQIAVGSGSRNCIFASSSTLGKSLTAPGETPFKSCLTKSNLEGFDFTEEQSFTDSDYFTQSQESPPKFSQKSESQIGYEEGSESQPGPAYLTLLDPPSLQIKAPLSPMKDKKKNFFLSSGASANRKSPLKARYNARTWVSNSEDSEGRCDDSSTSQTSSRSTGTSNSCDSKKQPEKNIEEVWDDFGDKNETICQVKPKGESFKGLTRVSTVPSSYRNEGERVGANANPRPTLLRANSGGMQRFEQTKLFEEPEGAKESIKVSRKEKELYVVIRSVKPMHESLEEGESQMFKEDIQYLLEGLLPTRPLSTKCLSLSSIASKALQSQFRMQVRAHAVLPRLSLLMNNNREIINTESLALCTACVLYVLSRDKLPLDVDNMTFALIVRLLKGSYKSDLDSKTEKNEVVKARSKIAKLLESLDDSASKLLASSQVTVDRLVLEVVLAVYSHRSSWSDQFKTQLMKCGVIDHVARAYTECAIVVTNKALSAEDEVLKLNLKMLLRCSRVIENVTYHHKENQSALIVDDSFTLIASAAKVFHFLVNAVKQEHEKETTCSVSSLDSSPELPPSAPGLRSSGRNPTESTNASGAQKSKASSRYQLEGQQTETEIDELHESLQECLIDGLGMCLNLTNESELGSTKMGNQKDLLPCLIECVIHTPSIISEQNKHFDVITMSLGLLINLMLYSPLNRRQFMQATTQVPHFFESPSTSSSKVGRNPNEQSNKFKVRGEVSAVEAFVKFFLMQDRLVHEIEEEEKLNETNSTEDEDETQGGGPVSPRRSSRSRQRGNSSSGVDNLLSCSSPERKQGSKPGVSSSHSLDDEFVDDGEGGMIWIGRTTESEDSMLGPRDREKKEEEERNNVIQQALEASGKHMESCLIAAFTALLIGCILQGNMNNIKAVLRFMPGASFQSMIDQLERVHKFMGLTTVANTGLLTSISTQIAVLKDANQKAVTLDEHF